MSSEAFRRSDREEGGLPPRPPEEARRAIPGVKPVAADNVTGSLANRVAAAQAEVGRLDAVAASLESEVRRLVSMTPGEFRKLPTSQRTRTAEVVQAEREGVLRERERAQLRVDDLELQLREVSEGRVDAIAEAASLQPDHDRARSAVVAAVSRTRLALDELEAAAVELAGTAEELGRLRGRLAELRSAYGVEADTAPPDSVAPIGATHGAPAETRLLSRLGEVTETTAKALGHAVHTCRG